MRNAEIEFRGDHIHVELAPGYSMDTASQEEFWKNVGSLCEQHKTRRVLVEGFAPEGEREPAEIVEAGERTAAIPKLWMAFHLNDFTPTEASELFQVIAAARGVRVKFFDEVERALMWLRQNTES